MVASESPLGAAGQVAVVRTGFFVAAVTAKAVAALAAKVSACAKCYGYPVHSFGSLNILLDRQNIRI